MNIVFFVNSLDSGGLENYLLRFLNHKSTYFNNVYIYCKSGRGGQLEELYSQIDNIEIIKKKLGFVDLNSYLDLATFLKSKKIDTVCDMTGDFGGLVLYTAKKSKVPNRVASYRSSENFFKPNLLKKIYNLGVRNLVLKSSTSILSNSKAAFNNFFLNIWENDSRFKIIYNGINASDFNNIDGDLRKKLNIPEDAFVVGHTGRFTPAKNHNTILQVAFSLINKFENIYFILCGNGVSENLSAQVKKMDMESKVFLFENRSDIPLFLNTMNCFLFPSITEGQPNALIEAMVLGIPCIASNIEPIKETIEVTNNLFAPQDVNGFVKTIENLYKTYNGTIYRLDNTEMVKKFDADILFDQFYNVLSDKKPLDF